MKISGNGFDIPGNLARGTCWCVGLEGVKVPLEFHKRTGDITLRIKRKSATPPPENEPILEPKHTRPLNSHRAIRQEMARVYRSCINGHISTGEGSRLIFMLREINAALAAEPQTLTQLKNNYVTTVNITGVPRGVYLSKSEIEESLSQFDPEPLPGHSTPMLKLIEHDDVEPEPPPRAA